MEIKILGCSGGRAPGFELTSYIIDQRLLLDAGGASASLDLTQQESLSHVILTHAHLDHIMGLGFIYQNTRSSRTRPLEVYATEPVIRAVRDHLFSPSILPGASFSDGHIPGLQFHPVSMEVPFKAGPYQVEAFPVAHTTGAFACRVSDSDHTLFFTGDTGRTERIWEWIRKRGGVDCLIAEVSFPNDMQDLAQASGHLTPKTLIESLKKAGLGPDHKVHVVHLKPTYLGELLDQIEAEEDWDLAVMRKGDAIRLERGKPKTQKPEIEQKVADKIMEFDPGADLYDQRHRLADQFGMSMKAGETVFGQGEFSKLMYIIQEGKVRIARRMGREEKTLAVLGQGDFFGEMAMLNNRPRSASAYAMSDTKLLAFDKRAFEKLVLENFGVALRIFRTLAQRLHHADGIIENLLYVDPRSKVVNTLIQAAIDEGIETEDGFIIRTTPEELSERSGVIIGTMKDIIAGLVEDKLIFARKGTITIPSLKKLRRLLKFLDLKDEFVKER